MPACLRYPSRPAPPAGSSDPAARHCLLYFVPGNPGLVDYYAPFLATLRLLLDEVEDRQPAVRFHIEGRNLLGFGGEEEGEEDQKRYGAGPYDLDTQIRATMDKVCAARRVNDDDDDDDDDNAPFDDIALIGHSVGSYISVEVIRRCEENKVAHPIPHAGILLFATLTHLAQSPRGRQLSRLLATPLLGPYVPQLLQTVAHGVFGWLPAVERVVVRGLLGFPAHAAAATLQFLSSPGGVRQALFLGGDELATIGADVWADEVWAAAAEKTKTPKFVIFFGQDDHWVANACRDAFIQRRRQDEAVQIVLDDTGLPHAFCIRHSEPVAERVKTWACAVMGVDV